MPVADLKIVAADGETILPPGEVGELWAKGPQIVIGYWNRPDATAETFVDGWVRTGDLAKLDAEGFLTIVDRAKDMIIRGGEIIYSIEVENVLYQHPAVGEIIATSRSRGGAPIADAHPALATLTDARFSDAGPGEAARGRDVVFLCLEHGESSRLAGEVLAAGPGLVVDLAADFRVRSRALYERYYGAHAAPELLPRFCYGLADIVGEDLGGLDGVVHSIGFAPQDALGGNFLNTPFESVATAMHVSAYSLKSLTMACLPLMQNGGSVVGLTFDAKFAWPQYDWMGPAKAALEATSRYVARDLGKQNIRCNLVSAGPLASMAAKSIPGFGELAAVWDDRSPLEWDLKDPEPAGRGVVALDVRRQWS